MGRGWPGGGRDDGLYAFRAATSAGQPARRGAEPRRAQSRPGASMTGAASRPPRRHQADRARLRGSRHGAGGGRWCAMEATACWCPPGTPARWRMRSWRWPETRPAVPRWEPRAGGGRRRSSPRSASTRRRYGSTNGRSRSGDERSPSAPHGRETLSPYRNARPARPLRQDAPGPRCRLTPPPNAPRCALVLEAFPQALLAAFLNPLLRPLGCSFDQRHIHYVPDSRRGRRTYARSSASSSSAASRAAWTSS